MSKDPLFWLVLGIMAIPGIIAVAALGPVGLLFLIAFLALAPGRD